MAPEAAEFTAEEQKYFDTKGAEGPVNDGTPAAPDADPALKTPETMPENNNIGQKTDKVEDPANPGQFIRRADYEKEVGHRKNLDNALREERQRNAERNARLEERLQILQQHLQPRAEPPQPIDPRVDFNGAWQQAQRELGELKNWQQQELQQRQQAYQAQQQFNAFSNAISHGEAEFAKTHADYYQAVDFAKQARVAELKSFGIFDENRIATILEQDVYGIAAEALQTGGNPAEVWYNYAKHRGFAAPQQPPVNQNAEKLKNIAAGQNAGKSLGAAAGAATPGLTLEALANMPDDEFKKVAMDKKAWRKLWGQ